MSGASFEGEVASIPTGTEDSYLTPEAHARREIDRQLVAVGWAVQDADKVKLAVGQGVALLRFGG